MPTSSLVELANTQTEYLYIAAKLPFTCAIRALRSQKPLPKKKEKESAGYIHSTLAYRSFAKGLCATFLQKIERTKPQPSYVLPSHDEDQIRYLLSR